MTEPIEVLFERIPTTGLGQVLDKFAAEFCGKLNFTQAMKNDGNEDVQISKGVPEDLSIFEWANFEFENPKVGGNPISITGRFYSVGPNKHDIELCLSSSLLNSELYQDVALNLFRYAQTFRKEFSVDICCGLEPASDHATQYFSNSEPGPLLVTKV